MNRILKIAGVIFGSLSTVYLVLVLNLIQVLSVLVYPISPQFCRAINRACARNIWCIWVIIGERFLGIKIRMVGDQPPLHQNALVIANHRAMTDILCLLSLAWRCGRLGDLKWFVKDQLKWVPGVGWGMKFMDCLFVRRNWQQDRAGMDTLFGRFKSNNIPMWLVSFLEGTRFTPKKQSAAQAFGQKRGLYMPDHTLIPRVKGFVTSVIGLREHLDAVYVLTLAYPRDSRPSLFRWFHLDIPAVDLDVRVYPIDSLPKNEEALGQWAYARYQDIDGRLKQYYRDGALAGDAFQKPILARNAFRDEAVRKTFDDG